MPHNYFWIIPALLFALQAHSQAPCYRLLFDGAGLCIIRRKVDSDSR